MVDSNEQDLWPKPLIVPEEDSFQEQVGHVIFVRLLAPDLLHVHAYMCCKLQGSMPARESQERAQRLKFACMR